MTVKELIDELSKYPAHSIVAFISSKGELWNINSVLTYPNSKNIILTDEVE